MAIFELNELRGDESEFELVFRRIWEAINKLDERLKALEADNKAQRRDE